MPSDVTSARFGHPTYPTSSDHALRPSASIARGESPTVRAALAGPTVVLVQGTGGTGIWMRREPGGARLKVWPEGAPLLVIGPDQVVDGQTWRQVRAVDGQAGWVSADYLSEVDTRGIAEILDGELGGALTADGRDGAETPSPGSTADPSSTAQPAGSHEAGRPVPTPTATPPAATTEALADELVAPTATLPLPTGVPEGALELPVAIATAYAGVAPSSTPAVGPSPTPRATSTPQPTATTKPTRKPMPTKTALIDVDGPPVAMMGRGW